MYLCVYNTTLFLNYKTTCTFIRFLAQYFYAKYLKFKENHLLNEKGPM